MLKVVPTIYSARNFLNCLINSTLNTSLISKFARAIAEQIREAGKLLGKDTAGNNNNAKGKFKALKIHWDGFYPRLFGIASSIL